MFYLLNVQSLIFEATEAVRFLQMTDAHIDKESYHINDHPIKTWRNTFHFNEMCFFLFFFLLTTTATYSLFSFWWWHSNSRTSIFGGCFFSICRTPHQCSHLLEVNNSLYSFRLLMLGRFHVQTFAHKLRRDYSMAVVRPFFPFPARIVYHYNAYLMVMTIKRQA